MIVPPSFSTKSADMQPQPVWKKRWSVGAKTPQIAMSACSPGCS